jgi:CheY-like chemotaxis protein
MSHLAQLFETHKSEETAVAAFYRPGARAETPARSRRSVLCLDRNSDLLAYLRELLRGAGHDVHTSNHQGDALLLMRVSRFDLLLMGADLAQTATLGIQSARAKLPVIELSSEFSTLDAGEAAVLARIEAQFDPKTENKRQSARGIYFSVRTGRRGLSRFFRPDRIG